MMYRSFIASVLAALVMPVTTQAQETCAGEKPIPHDDGRYHFVTESWRHQGAGVHHYGRCVDVRPPTEEMINSWIGVLPANAIARADRPTVGGLDFLENDPVNHSADLFYGNSDAKIVASYIAHRNEQSLQQEQVDVSLREKVTNLVKELGSWSFPASSR